MIHDCDKEHSGFSAAEAILARSVTGAYDEEYLPLAQRVMGDMLDYAVNTLDFELNEFYTMFLISGIAAQFEIGNPAFAARKKWMRSSKGSAAA